MSLSEKPMLFLQFATTSALRPENCRSELSFVLGLHLSLQSIVSHQKDLHASKVFHAAPSLPSVYLVAARSVD